MNSNDFVMCIGKASDSEEVQRAFATMGFAQNLEMPSDDIDARAEAPGLGLSLIFKQEGPQSSRLVVTAVKFLSNKEEGFSSFPGELPSGLSFSDVRADALAKLGEPLEPMPEFRRDIWRWNHLQLATRYTKAAPGHISVVTIELPFEE
ncbi:MAG: hypothetical protein RLZZ618_2795 [Pseudomonadota bacterium]